MTIETFIYNLFITLIICCSLYLLSGSLKKKRNKDVIFELFKQGEWVDNLTDENLLRSTALNLITYVDHSEYIMEYNPNAKFLYIRSPLNWNRNVFIQRNEVESGVYRWLLFVDNNQMLETGQLSHVTEPFIAACKNLTIPNPSKSD